MNTQELFEQIDALYETFKDEHSKSSKAAHGRAEYATQRGDSHGG